MGETFDVVVVGAGPAGSTAAYCLARAGARVLVVDRHDFPRHKACGGALFGCRDWPFANFLAIRDRLPTRPVSEAVFYHDRRPVCGLRQEGLFEHAERLRLDHLLLEEALAAGARFRRLPVKRLAPRGEGRRGYLLAGDHEAVTARFVIGADGFAGVTSRFLGNPRGPFGRCLEYDIEAEPRTRASHFFVLWGGELGYAWLFPTRDGYYAGLGFIGRTRQGLRPLLDGLLRHCVNEGLLPHQHRVRRLFGGPDPVAVVPRLAGPDLLLCGDAMGLVSQLSGDGIFFAMASGEQAAAAWGAPDPASRYRQLVQPLIRRATVCRRIPGKAASLMLARLALAGMAWLPSFRQLVFRKFFQRS
ncbi:MAG: NAD(P)/FAD-dependent oxidoreductase [Thermodesulfobacteriota bacterium]